MSPQSDIKLSVIIPALNEEARIVAAIASAFAAGADEVIVADGGSTDRTCEHSRSAGAAVIAAERGRGTQLNAGAAVASGDIFLFLHADAVLPPLAKNEIAGFLTTAGAGFFRLRFDSRSRMLRMVAAAANLRSEFFSLPYGDQALFLRRSLYQSLGGFRCYPFLEDIDLARRIRKKHALKCMKSSVTVSARRLLKPFPCAPLLLSARNALIAGLFCLGVHPDRLLRFYR